MNKYSSFALAGLILASSASFAGEPTQGWYLGLGGGVNYTPSLTFNFYHPYIPRALPRDLALSSLLVASYSPGSLVLNSGKITYGAGGDATFQLGYRCNYLRFEGEFLYNYSGYSKFNINGITFPRGTRFNNFSMKGNTTAVAGLFNIYYELYEDGTDPTWIPYVGLGVGYSYIQNELRFYFRDYNLNQLHNKNSSSEPIAQAILGINYLYNDDFTIGGDIRYLATDTLKHSNQRFSTATLNLVMNYSFDDGSY